MRLKRLNKKVIVSLAFAMIMLISAPLSACSNEVLLHKVYKKYFPVGIAVNEKTFEYYDTLIPQFNSVTPENDMKWEFLQPERGKFTYDKADKIVQTARDNKMGIRGHAYVWYRRSPAWVFKSPSDPSKQATKEELIQTMREHILEVGKHYKGQIYAWDVVNEVIADSDRGGEGIYRTGDESGNGPWYEIAGRDYIKEAFIAAREADPDAKLFYNDYGLNTPAKRERALKMLRWLIDEGVPIDGVGMQCHYNLITFNIEEFEASVKAYGELGLEVHITELDISVYPWDYTIINYGKTLPEEVEQAQAVMYSQMFDVFRRNKNIVTSVTFWGVADDITWHDGDPIPGRKNWPLLFDINHQPKLAFKAITNF